jgi:hypothetical protein
MTTASDTGTLADNGSGMNVIRLGGNSHKIYWGKGEWVKGKQTSCLVLVFPPYPFPFAPLPSSPFFTPPTRDWQ